MPDGSTIQSETGVVVQAPAKLPGLVLQLDKREIDSGARLTGVVHTRFAGAKLLLTLRDSQGIKLTKPITTAANGVAKIDEALPANLRYGCAVCVQYPESATTIHADQRELFVIPTDRTISVTTTVPDEVGPGADIKLGVQLDRQEEVDLIVSVFDESLLGVSGDLSKNIRDFYLADARGQGRAARELAATRVGQRHRRRTRGEGRGAAEGQGPAREGTGAGAAAQGTCETVEGGQARVRRCRHAGSARRARSLPR